MKRDSAIGLCLSQYEKKIILITKLQLSALTYQSWLYMYQDTYDGI